MLNIKLIKIDCQYSEKRSFIFFMNNWHDNQSCRVIFVKSFHVYYKFIVFNNSLKEKLLCSKCSSFTQIYSPQLSVDDQTVMIFAILYRKVIYILSAKYQPNRSSFFFFFFFSFFYKRFGCHVFFFHTNFIYVIRTLSSIIL